MRKKGIKKSPAPYAQIAQDLRDQIHAGRLKPGDMVPSVRQLAANWGVSAATADKALAALRSEGLVVGVSGVGTQVAAGVNANVQSGGVRFRRMLSGGKATRLGERSEIVSSDLVDAPDHVAAALEIEPGARVVKRVRRFHDEEGLSALSTSWLNGDLAEAVPALLSTDKIEGGTIGAISEATGRNPGPGADIALARLATDEELAAFGIEGPAAVLSVETRLCDTEGSPLEFGNDVIAPEHPWPVNYDLSLS